MFSRFVFKLVMLTFYIFFIFNVLFQLKTQFPTKVHLILFLKNSNIFLTINTNFQITFLISTQIQKYCDKRITAIIGMVLCKFVVHFYINYNFEAVGIRLPLYIIIVKTLQKILPDKSNNETT